MKNIAVILSGCGVFDGSEIHEATLTMLYIEKNGASYQCFAPNIEQHHVIDHTTGNETGESRNVLTESARIARGEVLDLANLSADEYDGIAIVGGFGVAKNLSDFAFNGANATVNELLKKVCSDFFAARKPALFMCIAPTIAPHIYPSGCALTIGNDKSTAEALTKLGAHHVESDATGVVIDDANKLITTPGYMLAGNIAELSEGIEKAVSKFIAFI